MNPVPENSCVPLKDHLLAFGDTHVNVLRANFDASIEDVLAMQHEIAFLEDELGPDHPQVTSLRQRMFEIANAANEIEVLRERLSIRPPAVEKNGVAVQIRVIDVQDRGTPGMKLRLLDPNGNPIKGLPVALTDEFGVASFVLAPGLAEKLGRTFCNGLHYAITGENDELLYQSETPLKIAPDDRIFLEMKLDRPERIESRLKTTGKVGVPNCIACDRKEAAALLENAGLNVRWRSAQSPDATEDHVIDQNPAPGTEVKPGATVVLTAAAVHAK